MSPNQDYSSTPLCIPLHPSIPLCTRQVDLMARSLQRVGIRRALVVHSKGLDEISPMGMSVRPSTWIVSLPNGSVTLPHGSLTLPHGSVSLPHGSVTLPHESLSPMGPADVTQDSVRPFGVIHSFSSPCRLSPAPVAADYGIARCTIEDLKGGVKALNAQQVAIADALVSAREGSSGSAKPKPLTHFCEHVTAYYLTRSPLPALLVVTQHIRLPSLLSSLLIFHSVLTVPGTPAPPLFLPSLPAGAECRHGAGSVWGGKGCGRGHSHGSGGAAQWQSYQRA
ncbi:unnamed protein product [Closterium sp. Naga37s-1]|nr:unnamed protein product [Closterium sp. Naga37s-1]